MLKKTITYENPFTQKKTTEDFWFHISKAAIVRMDVEEHAETYTDSKGEELVGMRAKMQRMVDAEDGKALMPLFEDLIRRSYGVKQGDRFMQSEELWQDFKGSGAFDELLFILCTDAEQAGDFMNGAMPSNLKEIAEEASKKAAAVKKAAKTKPKASAKKKAGQESLEESSAIAAVEKVAADSGAVLPERELEIAQATTDNPVELTTQEMLILDGEDLKTGLASGRFTLA